MDENSEIQADINGNKVIIQGRIISNPFKHIGHYVVVINAGSIFCRDCGVTMTVVTKK